MNLFADMGAQPATLMSGLTPATASTDTTAPTSTITSPAQGATLSDGSAVTISGTATDAGGGVVAGVEVSTDGGSTWHPVTTMSAANTSVTWSYSWVAHGNPDGDDQDPGGRRQRQPGDTRRRDHGQRDLPVLDLGNQRQPRKTADSGDPASIEVGVKFKADTSGIVTGIRFYKASTNTGTHIGNLWTSTGQLLASATFTGETALRLAAGELRAASGDESEHHLRRVLLRAQGALLAGRVRTSTPLPPMGTAPTITNVDSPPLHALRNTNGVVNGVYSVRRQQHLPDQLSSTPRTTGSTRSSPRRLSTRHPARSATSARPPATPRRVSPGRPRRRATR